MENCFCDRHVIFIPVCDFYTKVGNGKKRKEDLGTMNENGEMLTDICKCELIIAGTVFPLPS